MASTRWLQAAGAASGRGLGVLALPAFSVLAAALVRVPVVLAEDFPLGDGGLFLAIVESLRSSRSVIPAFVPFNGESVPFAYPPLGFWLAVAFSALSGLEPVEALRWLPLAFSLATAALVPLLARDLLGEEAGRPWIAAVVFAFLPRTWVWPLMGGGLTRSPGFFFTLLAVLLAGRASRRAPRGALFTGAALAGACLSHPEWAVTATVAVVLRLLCSGPAPRERALALLRVFAVATPPVAPWALVVLVRHGLRPFFAAAGTGGHSLVGFLLSLLDLGVFQSGYAAVSPALLAAAGAASLFLRRSAFLPLWLVAIGLTTPRHAPTPAAAVIALLASEGCAALAGAARASWPRLRWSGPGATATSAALAGAWLALTAWVGRGVPPPAAAAAVPRPAREAMEWIRVRTDPHAAFVVLTPGRDWSEDAIAEWFPVLARRASMTTAQGLEWLPAPAFLDRVSLIRTVKTIQARQPGRLAEELRLPAPGPLHVAVFLPGAPPQFGSFLASGRWELLLNAPGALVFRERRPG